MHVTGSGGGLDPRVRERADVTIQLGHGASDPSGQKPVGGMVGDSLADVHYYIAKPEELARNPKGPHARGGGAERGNYPHLVELMTGQTPGRTSDQQISHFIDYGTQGLQFAVVAGTVYQRAKERGLGRELPTDWFVQDIRD